MKIMEAVEIPITKTATVNGKIIIVGNVHLFKKKDGSSIFIRLDEYSRNGIVVLHTNEDGQITDERPSEIDDRRVCELL